MLTDYLVYNFINLLYLHAFVLHSNTIQLNILYMPIYIYIHKYMYKYVK